MQTEATKFNYEAIKMLAAERKCKTEDLMVLARNNDPFYVGTDAHWRDAEWFKNVWQNFEYQHGSEIHLRRIHYRLISQKDLKLFSVTDDVDEVVEIIQRHYKRWRRKKRPEGHDTP